VVGWLLVLSAVAGVLFGVLGIALGGYHYEDGRVVVELDGATPASIMLLVVAATTAVIAVPAMIARRRTDRVWPLRWLRNAALISTFLNAFVDFATDGFGALIGVSIGLFTLALLNYQISVAALREVREGVRAPADSVR
jgi:hypothetical protein